MSLNAALAAWWKFDNSLADASGNGNTFSATVPPDTYITGKIGQAGRWPNADLSHGPPTAYVNDTTTAVSTWVATSGLQDGFSLLGLYDGNRDTLPFALVWSDQGGGLIPVNSSGTPLGGVWSPMGFGAGYHHVAVNVNTSSQGGFYADLFGDGVYYGRATDGDFDWSDSENYWYWGQDQNGFLNALDYALDLTGTWARALTYGSPSLLGTAGGEVAQLFNLGAGLDYPFPDGGFASGLFVPGLGV
jgi:hypothetical protein